MKKSKNKIIAIKQKMRASAFTAIALAAALNPGTPWRD